jgi:hypothetical protein
MTNALFVAYLSLPALVSLAVVAPDVGPTFPSVDGLVWFTPSYLFFAAPQITWLVIATIFDKPVAVVHAGLAGATGLLGILLFMSLHGSLGTGLPGGLVYLCASPVVIAISAKAAVLFGTKSNDAPDNA